MNIKEIFNNKKFVLWGGGRLHQEALINFKYLPINIIVDSYKIDHDKNIYSPEEFFLYYSSNDTYVIITIASEEAKLLIGEILSHHGFLPGINFTDYQTFLNKIYPHYLKQNYNKIYSISINFFVTHFCNLKCKKCSTKIPYLPKKHKINKNYTNICNDAKEYFRLVDYTHTINLVGGETLLWPYLSKFIIWLYENYVDKFYEISIFSNQTIIPSNELLNVMNQVNSNFYFSNYDSVKHLQKRKEIKDICEKNNVKFHIIEYNNTNLNWIDIGMNKESHNKMRNNQFHWESCLPVYRAVVDGKLFYCGNGYWANLNEHIPITNGILELKNTTKEEFYNFYYGLNTNIYPKYCEFCNGYRLTAPSIPVAEQLE